MPHYRFEIGDIFRFNYTDEWYVIGRIHNISKRMQPVRFEYKVLWKSESHSHYETDVGNFTAFSYESKMYRKSVVIDEKTAILEVL